VDRRKGGEGVEKGERGGDEDGDSWVEGKEERVEGDRVGEGDRLGVGDRVGEGDRVWEGDRVGEVEGEGGQGRRGGGS